jgi:hypothetical protein
VLEQRKISLGMSVPHDPDPPRKLEQREAERAASFEPAVEELERALDMVGQSNLPGAIESFRKVI